MWPTPTNQNKIYCCLRVNFSLLHSWGWVQEALQVTLETTHSSQMHKKQNAAPSSLCKPVKQKEAAGDDTMQGSGVMGFD